MSDSPVAQKLQRLVDKENGKKHTHSVVLGVQSADGRIAFAGAAGAADVSGSTPMTPDTPYYLASITKLYTAAVIMKLHETGQLDLDQPITAYLPGTLTERIHVYKGDDYSRQIKVYQLVNQTSGLADYFEEAPEGGQSFVEELKAGQDQLIDVAGVVAIVRRLTPKFEPGAKHGGKAHYADTNYQLLGAIIEVVTGHSLRESFQRLIFAPFGLEDTYVFDYTSPRHPAPAPVYDRNSVLHIPKAMSSFAPDGGMVATLAESLTFLRAFFDGRLFDKGLFDRMTARWNGVFFPIQYGYGLMRFKLPRLMSPFRPIPELLGHSGSTGSFAFYSPAKSLYLAGTLNQIDAPGRPYQFMAQVLNAVR